MPHLPLLNWCRWSLTSLNLSLLWKPHWSPDQLRFWNSGGDDLQGEPWIRVTRVRIKPPLNRSMTLNVVTGDIWAFSMQNSYGFPTDSVSSWYSYSYAYARIHLVFRCSSHLQNCLIGQVLSNSTASQHQLATQLPQKGESNWWHGMLQTVSVNGSSNRGLLPICNIRESHMYRCQRCGGFYFFEIVLFIPAAIRSQ